ncbi:MAG: hypothetical protein ABS79_05640 [Planctomycetes bacterium SCN 63-9]|nr:MAG: hypothetical protein ABS79_05640 [Planctomycetes bacterium SCN 63-9]
MPVPFSAAVGFGGVGKPLPNEAQPIASRTKRPVPGTIPPRRREESEPIRHPIGDDPVMAKPGSGWALRA